MTTELLLYPGESDDPLILDIEFAYHAPGRGARDSLGGRPSAGPPLEPDDPADIELLSATDRATGAGVQLSPHDEQSVTEACWAHLAAAAEAAWDRE